MHATEVQDVTLFGDKIATQVALRNFIDNAIKHNRGANLAIEIQVIAVGSEYFEISVSDNGSGMEEPHSLFKGETPKTIDGGFGLYAVSRLLRSRGGKVAACASEGSSGLKIVFSLPGRVLATN